MKTFWKHILFLFVILAFQSTFAETNTDKVIKIDQIIIFGDSLSDNGNVYSLTKSLHDKVTSKIPIIPQNPPYYEGRFSNGPVWIENVARVLDVPLYDYAYGGSWAEPVLESGQVVPIGLDMQVNMYAASAVLDRNIANHLYVFWTGSNDYVRGRDDVEYATTNTVNTIQKNIEWLAYYYGARNFLVLNLPDVSMSPQVIEEAAEKGPEFPGKVAEMIKLHNKKLAERLATIRANYPNITLIELDVTQNYDDMLRDPGQYGLTNVIEPCFGGGYWLKGAKGSQGLTANDPSVMELKKVGNIDLMSNPSLRTAYQTADLAAKGLLHQCKNPDEYLFWDHLHPTTAVHSYVSLLVLTAFDGEIKIKGNA